MLEIIITMLALTLTVLAAKKGRRRFNLRKVRITPELTIGALATKDVISTPGTGAAVGTLRVMSIDMTYNWSNLGATDDDALEFGWAHSDYTAVEIEECLEATASMDIGDKIAQEQANRLVRVIGSISGAVAGAAGGGATFNDGRPVKTKLNWRLAIGDTMKLWARNGSGTVYTTGSSLVGLGNMWVKDSA